jgi:hypothetical protein
MSSQSGHRFGGSDMRQLSNSECVHQIQFAETRSEISGAPLMGRRTVVAGPRWSYPVRKKESTMMIRSLAVFVTLVGLALPVHADSRAQLLRHVERDLPSYVDDVRADSLTTTQLARIYNVMHSRETSSEKQMHIRSIIGGRNTLRGLLGIGGSSR